MKTSSVISYLKYTQKWGSDGWLYHNWTYINCHRKIIARWVGTKHLTFNRSSNTTICRNLQQWVGTPQTHYLLWSMIKLSVSGQPTIKSGNSRQYTTTNKVWTVIDGLILILELDRLERSAYRYFLTFLSGVVKLQVICRKYSLWCRLLHYTVLCVYWIE